MFFKSSLEASQFGVGLASKTPGSVALLPNFDMNYDVLLLLLMDVDVGTFHHTVLFCQGRASTIEALLASRTTQADLS